MTQTTHHRGGSSRPGAWLPPHAPLDAWVGDLARRVADAPSTQLHPVVARFGRLIDSDPIVRLYVTRMIDEVPHRGPFRVNHLKSVGHMLAVIDAVIGQAPAYDESALVGTPLNAVLDWVMGTPAGFAAFRLPAVNASLREILGVWRNFLNSPQSLYVLNESAGGWKSPAARAALGMDDFEHDPDHPSWGYSSWNDFFTRRFKAGRRPVDAPDDGKAIANACESTPYRIGRNVRRSDRFWLKSQPYSLGDMLGNAALAERFEGGVVYQAYLSPFNYHRWHSPVSGTIRSATVLAGTYYSELESEGEDPAGPNNSQAYITHVATRALILIEADDPVIGLMAVLPVGMGEVSSCLIGADIAPGRRVAKGDELGCFQFGGSTHCLIFRPGVIAEFAPAASRAWGDPAASVIPLGARLAQAS